LSGLGISELFTHIECMLKINDQIYDIKINSENGKKLAFAYSHAVVLDRRDQVDHIFLKLLISQKNKAKLTKIK